MSVYVARNGIYQIDFQVQGRRFQQNSKTRNRKEALAIEAKLRKQFVAEIELEEATGNGPLTLDSALGRYWDEVGRNHKNAKDTYRNLEMICTFLGPKTRMDRITDREVAALVAWRRQHFRGGTKAGKKGGSARLVSKSTVNRTVTQPLKYLFGRAKRTWHHSFPLEPIWREHLLKEPKERIRELRGEESDALENAVRPDYAEWLEFARLTGRRHAETLIRWSDVNWAAEEITTRGKDDTIVSTPITPTIRALLEPLRGHHAEWVFTYVAKKARNGQIRGQRYPITASGSKTEWRRARARSGVEDFRFHDIRHDVATKMLRKTGNFKIVQQAMNHKDIRTTARYAHVLNSEVAEALELLALDRRKPPEKSPEQPLYP